MQESRSFRQIHASPFSVFITDNRRDSLFYHLWCLCWSQEKLPLAIPLEGFVKFPVTLHPPLREIYQARIHSSFSIEFCDTDMHVIYVLYSNQRFKNLSREKQVFIFNNSQRKTKFKRSTITCFHRSLRVFSQGVFLNKWNFLTKGVGENFRDLFIS